MKSDRPSRLEPLEYRLLLDGDVTASLRDGDLTIRGDEEDNQIVITQSKSRTVHIEGVDGTTINGKESVTIQKFNGDLILLFAAKDGESGEDSLSIKGRLRIPGNLSATLSAGELVVEGSAGPVTVGGSLTARAGDEGHVHVRNDVRIGGEVSIKAGGNVDLAAGQAILMNFAAARFNDSLTIDNPYMPLVPGTTYTYQAIELDEDTGETITEDTIVEVLNSTKTILGIQARVVRDRVFVDGVLVEDTHDWFAQDDNGNVWYLGEDVINYEYDANGNLIGTDNDGAWQAGEDGAVAGVVMLARPQVGLKYYQEFSPNDALDQGEVLALGESFSNAAGTFSNVLRTLDTTVMEPFAYENKLYAPGVGLVGELHIDLEDDEIESTNRLISVKLNGETVSQVVRTEGFRGTNPTGRAIGGISVSDDAYLKSGLAVVIQGATFEDELTVRSEEQLVITDSSLEDGARLNSRDTISLRNIFSRDAVRIEGNPDDLYIFDSQIGSLKAFLSTGDDVVVVRDSSFGRFEADGGPGNNTFEDEGDNHFGKLKLRHFNEATRGGGVSAATCRIARWSVWKLTGLTR